MHRRLKDIEGYFKRQQIEEKSRRISHQGNFQMSTCNPQAAWLKGYAPGPNRELKPDFMILHVKTEHAKNPREAHQRQVRPILPQTILPPPSTWEPKLMEDSSFPTVICKDPVWECLELFWECKRNEDLIDDAEVILDCTLKATEALRYQWSRRFVYCFLHCGTKMKLLQFDRSGLLASEAVNLVDHTDVFVRCLIGAFCHNATNHTYD
ncbi:hypothetical protein V8E54_006310 [Elaphomyces granulatus]|jgi:hypothetical protein